LLAWRNWQTRTAQDRMGKPVEVRVLSRAVSFVPQTDLQQKAKQKTCNASWMTDYFAAAFLLAAQRAFINWESFLRPAGVSWPFFLAEVAVVAPPLNLSQRALAAAESFARVEGEK